MGSKIKLDITLRQWIVSAIALAFITVLVYLPSLYYGFVFDDNPNITKFFGIRYKTFADLFFSGTRWISYWLNTCYYSIAKFDPFIYRAGNLVFHILTGLLVFYTLSLALSNLKKPSFFSANAYYIAFTSALIFLLHPVQTQTVSYVIQGQLEGLAGLFILAITLCLLLFSKAKTTPYKGLISIILLILVFFACGTKEIVIVTPLLLLLTDWFFIAQGDIKSVLSRLFLHITIAVIICSSYLYLLKPQFFIDAFGLKKQAYSTIGNLLTQNYRESITAYQFCISQFKVILHYIWIFIWPFNLSPDYDWPLVSSFFSLSCLIPLSILLLTAAIIIQRLRKNSTDLFSFAMLWFFITILPRASIVPSSELVADYKTYIASFGLIFILASSLVIIESAFTGWLNKQPLISKRQHYIISCLFLLITLSLGFATYTHNKVRSSNEAFWKHVIKQSPNKARGHSDLAIEFIKQKKYDQALAGLKKAIELDQNNIYAWTNLAYFYYETNNIDAAIEAINKAISLSPGYPEAHFNLGNFLVRKQNYKQAEEEFKRAIELRPTYGKAYFMLGKLKKDLKEKEQAWHYFKKCCIDADYDNQDGFLHYAILSKELEKYDEANFALKKALAINPNSEQAWLCFGWLNSDLESYDNAIIAFEKVLAINKESISAICELAFCYREKNNYQKASELYTKAAMALNDPCMWCNAGQCYIELNNWQDAYKAYNQAHMLNFNMLTPYLPMAYCLEKMEKYSQAYMLLSNFLSLEQPDEIKLQAQTALDAINKILSHDN